jgi:sugar-specific transcriptional regulator TrmB
MEIQVILKNFGLSEKEIAVYLALVELGPSSVREISAKSKVNRGTSYDILKSLIALGIVSYYNKESKQYFMAEAPEKLLSAIDQKKKTWRKSGRTSKRACR